jgi:hypothetical protein
MSQTEGAVHMPVQVPPQPSLEPPHFWTPASAQSGAQQAVLPFCDTHSCPVAQPWQIPPQPSDSPQAFPEQSATQQMLLTHCSPASLTGHWQVPPQPSPTLQALSAQFGTQQARAPDPPSVIFGWQVPSVHPVHMPPQPSLFPHEPAGQLGTQTHCWNSHTPASQLGVQQVSSQVPLTQTWVPPQIMPAQRLGTHATCAPSMQLSPPSQVPIWRQFPPSQLTLAQGSGTTQISWQAAFGPQLAAQPLKGSQAPVLGLQTWSGPQVTFLQWSTPKQPGRHW